jgi:trehalose/maltose hydrolase-like predicted phosphorylase
VLRFRCVWNGQPLRITIEPARVTVEHRGSKAIRALVYGRAVALAPGKKNTFGRA